MPSYLLYSDDLETPEPDEQETFAKIVELMTKGMHISRDKYGRSVRISHAKAHAELKGTLTVHADLPVELAQGMFAAPGTYDVLVRMAQAPGEFVDDSKVSTDRGMAVKVLGVHGSTLDDGVGPVQDWVFDVGKQFISGNAKAFLQAFKPNAEIAPKLSDNVKGVVSKVAAATNAVLHAVGANSEKLAFYGHPPEHPLATAYFSQTAYRYGNYVAKLGFFPADSKLEALAKEAFESESPDALREAMIAYFKANAATFEMRVQLNTGLDEMPIEDATAAWPEDRSHYRTVATLQLPVQTAWDPARDAYFEDVTFSPAHALRSHRPLGSINRARMVVYKALADRRLAENGKAEIKPADVEAVPA